ncbi:MAG: hypothetical protein COV45_05310 [Deltaproteobacteria bacterium CG11_big_fil_rev_8_21_14_0_20_47_16]|nr:MAG: hypothetical protein COV45_05310 [Deltaproteobacteria bacterium CG11_big_fil_rev_8_21_14_0_20_47_16]
MTDSLSVQLSIVIPALNEEKCLADAVATARQAAAQAGVSCEVIVVNDGSTDNTGKLAAQHADRVIHHASPIGLGGSFSEGIAAAKGQYVVMVPGDNEVEGDAIQALFTQFNNADIVTLYPVNPQVRRWYRQWISTFFNGLVRWSSGVALKYYNGPTMYRTQLVQACLPVSAGFGYNAELLITLIRGGASFCEIPMHIKFQAGRRSRAWRFSNWFQVGATLFKLFLSRFFKGLPKKVSV